MKKSLKIKKDYLMLLTVGVVIVFILFSLVTLSGSFNLFPNSVDQAEEVYINPDTGTETIYNPNYITEEEIRQLDEHFEDLEKEHPHETEPITPVP